MTNKQKEMLVLCFHYYNSWSLGEKEDDKRVVELMKVLTANRSAVDRREVMKYLESGVKRLEKITEGDNIIINGLIFCLNFIFLLVEENALKGYSAMAVKRLVLEIYTTWEAKERHQNGFKTANIIATRYYIVVGGREVTSDRIKRETKYLYGKDNL